MLQRTQKRVSFRRLDNAYDGERRNTTNLPLKVLLKTHKQCRVLFVVGYTINHMSMGMQYIALQCGWRIVGFMVLCIGIVLVSRLPTYNTAKSTSKSLSVSSNKPYNAAPNTAYSVQVRRNQTGLYYSRDGKRRLNIHPLLHGGFCTSQFYQSKPSVNFVHTTAAI